MKLHSTVRIAGLLLIMIGVVALAARATDGTVSPVAASTDSSVFLPSLLVDEVPLVVSSPFGVQVYGNTNPWRPYYDDLLGLGAAWVRNEIHWDDVEPVNTTPDNYEWRLVDAALAVARPDRGGLQMIVTVENAPGWATLFPGPGQTDGPLKEEALPELAEFMAALAERYDGDGVDDAPGSPVVHYWEIYNEPDRSNTNYPYRWGEYGDQYARMLQAIYQPVKDANPQAQIVLGGLAYDAFIKDGGVFVEWFLDKVLDTYDTCTPIMEDGNVIAPCDPNDTVAGGDYFDVMNFHSYPAFYTKWTNNQGPGLYGKATAIRNVLSQYGEGNKPIIVTEAGWHSDDGHSLPFPGNETVQARFVVILGAEALAADLEIYIWWMLFDPGGDYPYENGIVDKQGYDVYKRMVATLGYAEYQAAVTSVNSTLQAHRLTNQLNGRTIYVAWLNPVDTTAQQNLQLPASRVLVTNSRTGSAAVVTGPGTVNLTVGADPIYIEVEQ